MLSIGKMNPDNINDGSIDAKVAAVKATCCESATVEMNIPKLVLAIIKTRVLKNINK